MPKVKEKKFKVYWIDGTTNIVAGRTIEKALWDAGYGFTALLGIVNYKEVKRGKICAKN